MGRGANSSVATLGARRRTTSPSQPSLVPGTPFNASELAAYADALLDAAGVSEGDIISCRVLYPSQLWLSEALADAARTRGALFEAMCEPGAFEDPHSMQHLLDNEAVFIELSSFSPSEIENQKHLDGPYQEDWEEYNRAQDANQLRWNIAMSPNSEWAQQVYPELEPNQAYRQLGQDFLGFMRIDGAQSWSQHLQTLKARAQKINSLHLTGLKIIGEGTELELPISSGAHFLPVQWETENGQEVCVNSPTEEIFTTPDPYGGQGTFSSSRPLVLEGEVITGITGEIKDGRLISLQADNTEHTSLLNKAFLASDGMDRLGEIGLVDSSGPISRSQKIFYNNIIDENAGTHLGFGHAYTVAGGQGNQSSDHDDIIIGSEEMRIIGIDDNGNEIPLISDGLWQL